mgnify:FL=1
MPINLGGVQYVLYQIQWYCYLERSTMWIQLNLVFLLIRNGFSFEGLFDALDLHMLDDIDFCQIQLDPNLGRELFESSHYITFDEKHSCAPTLVVKRLEVNTELFQDHKFIKDPEKTFLFLNDQETIPEPIHVEKYQPYHFVATRYSTEILVQEIQVYVGKVERVVVLNKTNHGWKMDESTFQSVESRRSDFHGITLKAHYESFLKTDGFIDEHGNFLGYNGELATLVSNRFNVTYDLSPLTTFGIKLKNGSFTGTVKELKENNLDLAIGFFDHIPERLEVTDGGFTSILIGNEIFYWKDKELVVIFNLIFTKEIWITLIISLLVSSFYLSLEYRLETPSSNNMIEALINNFRVLLAMDLGDDWHHQRRYSIRLHILFIGLCGAIVVWIYSGLLISYFSIESEEHPISSFDDLIVKTDLKLVLTDGYSSTQGFIRATQNNPYLESALEGKVVMVPSGQEMFDGFLETVDANSMIISQLYLLSYEIMKSYKESSHICQIRVGYLDGFRGKVQSGWLYPKHSILKRQFDKFLFELGQTGIERQISEKYFFLDPFTRCETTFTPIGIQIVAVLFHILGFGLVFAAITLAMEHVFHQCK